MLGSLTVVGEVGGRKCLSPPPLSMASLTPPAVFSGLLSQTSALSPSGGGGLSLVLSLVPSLSGHSFTERLFGFSNLQIPTFPLGTVLREQR